MRNFACLAGLRLVEQAGRPKNGLLAMTNDFDCANSCERNYDKENFNNLPVSCNEKTLNKSYKIIKPI
jgi:hypothetical protein